jgi:hypothetical protein
MSEEIDTPEEKTEGEKLILELQGGTTIIVDGGLARQAAIELTKLYSKDKDDTTLGLECFALETQAEDLQKSVGVWEALQHLENSQYADKALSLFYAVDHSQAGASEYIRMKTAIDSLTHSQRERSAVYVSTPDSHNDRSKVVSSNSPWMSMIEKAARDSGVKIIENYDDYVTMIKAGAVL